MHSSQMALAWMLTSFIFSFCGLSFLLMCRIKRHSLAKQFYVEWLHSLPNNEIDKLKPRLKRFSEELKLIETMNACAYERQTLTQRKAI